MISRNLLAFAICSLASSAFAAPVLDQKVGSISDGNLFAPIYGNVWNVNGYDSSEATQTFTVGVSGKLSDIQFYSYSGLAGIPTSLTVQVWNLNGVSPDFLLWDLPPSGGIGWVEGLPGAVLLGSTDALSGSPGGAPTQAEFESQDISVAAGDFLAFVVGTSGSTEVEMVGITPSFYSGGAGYLSNVDVPGYDYIFSTYVDPSVSAPEPSSWLVLVVGIVGLLTLRRRA
jgi:hypothetical protein